MGQAGQQEQDMTASTTHRGEVGRPVLPPIDLEAADDFRTATFAFG